MLLHDNLKIKKTLLSAINMHECQCQFIIVKLQNNIYVYR